jgi:UMF1 family MFS transporter
MCSLAPHRKALLLTFAAIGSLAAIFFLLLPSSSPVWYLSAPLAMFANVGFGASVVAMNSYIPSLAKEAPEVVKILNELEPVGDVSATDVDSDPDTSTENPSAPLLGSSAPVDVDKRKRLEEEYQAELSRATSRISSLGIALGYGAGIALLIVALIPVTKLHGSTFALRLAIGLSGIWWAVFTIPAAIWLPSTQYAHPSQARNGREDTHGIDEKEWNAWREIVAAWVRLGNMLRWREIKKLRNTFKYLAAWFLLSDGKSRVIFCHLVRKAEPHFRKGLPQLRPPRSSSAKLPYTCRHLRSSLSAFSHQRRESWARWHGPSYNVNSDGRTSRFSCCSLSWPQ